MHESEHQGEPGAGHRPARRRQVQQDLLLDHKLLRHFDLLPVQPRELRQHRGQDQQVHRSRQRILPLHPAVRHRGTRRPAGLQLRRLLRRSGYLQPARRHVELRRRRGHRQPARQPARRQIDRPGQQHGRADAHGQLLRRLQAGLDRRGRHEGHASAGEAVGTGPRAEAQRLRRGRRRLYEPRHGQLLHLQAGRRSGRQVRPHLARL